MALRRRGASKLSFTCARRGQSGERVERCERTHNLCQMPSRPLVLASQLALNPLALPCRRILLLVLAENDLDSGRCNLALWLHSLWGRARRRQLVRSGRACWRLRRRGGFGGETGWNGVKGGGSRDKRSTQGYWRHWDVFWGKRFRCVLARRGARRRRRLRVGRRRGSLQTAAGELEWDGTRSVALTVSAIAALALSRLNRVDWKSQTILSLRHSALIAFCALSGPDRLVERRQRLPATARDCPLDRPRCRRALSGHRSEGLRWRDWARTTRGSSRIHCSTDMQMTARLSRRRWNGTGCTRC